MRKTGVLMAAMVIAMLTGAAPAFASFGAIAYDQATGRYGFSWNEASQDRANQLALKDCGSDKCRVIPVPPAKCGALDGLGEAQALAREVTDGWATVFSSIRNVGSGRDGTEGCAGCRERKRNRHTVPGSSTAEASCRWRGHRA